MHTCTHTHAQTPTLRKLRGRQRGEGGNSWIADGDTNDNCHPLVRYELIQNGIFVRKWVPFALQAGALWAQGTGQCWITLSFLLGGLGTGHRAQAITEMVSQWLSTFQNLLWCTSSAAGEQAALPDCREQELDSLEGIWLNKCWYVDLLCMEAPGLHSPHSGTSVLSWESESSLMGNGSPCWMCSAHWHLIKYYVD